MSIVKFLWLIYLMVNRKSISSQGHAVEYPANKKNSESESFIENNYSIDSATEDLSYEGLSTKNFYNDYVNGYKYYLNFQNNREEDDQKYSNLIKYQAHKHHKVDDIGKYILEKIPNLQSTKKKRRFVESGTLEDQEVTTKSEDSWFKKHFFVFIDKEPAKKFHSSQTVALKPVTTNSYNNKRNSNVIVQHPKTTPTSTSTQSKIGNRRKDVRILDHKKIDNHIQSFLCNNDYTFDVNDVLLDDTKRMKRKLKSKNVEFVNYPINDNIQSTTSKVETLPKSAVTNQKCGFVDVSLVHKPTAIVKLYDCKKHNNRIAGLLEKLHLRKKSKSKSKVGKREQRRLVRFNPVKKIKEIFSVRPDITVSSKGNYFDYEYITPQKTQSDQRSSINVPTIADMIRQIPNITEDKVYEYYKSNVNKYDESYWKDVQDTKNKHDDSYTSKVKDITKDQSLLSRLSTESTKHTEEENPSGLIIMDTTALAYDDSFAFLEDYFETKQIRLAAKPSTYGLNDKYSESKGKTFAKINTPPQQYYNTPLPMTMKDFNKFLKDNAIDVESVTASNSNKKTAMAS